MGKSKYGTSGGVELTDDLIEHLAEEAEEGYDAEQLRPRSRRGRPPIGSEAAVLFQVRLEPELREALATAARGEHTSPSEMTRRALRTYLQEIEVSPESKGKPRKTRQSSLRSRGVRVEQWRRSDARDARTMSKPGLADQRVLMRWADSVGARSEFPRLVRRLILETGRGVVQLGFPAGEGVAVGSWDGTVRATEPTAFVPKGLSLWELSVEKSVGKKADSDYNKRLAADGASPTTSCTYIAASLRRWRDRAAWARDRAADGRWADVRAYGLDDIETWLETAPVTHAWISEELGLGPYGLRAAESWWMSWACATTPSMTAGLVLAGRTDAVDELWKRLASTPQLTTIGAGSVEEVLAFLAAVGVQAVANGDPRLLARTAFVDDVQAWRALVGAQGQLLLVAASEQVIAEASAGGEHHIVIPVMGRVGSDIELPAIDASDATAALKAAGIKDDPRAHELGSLARRSLVALRRRIANKPELHVPDWARSPIPREVRGVLLAGRWHEDNDSDREALAILTGISYEDLREFLTAHSTREDPFVASVDRSWGLVSPFDAWSLLGPHLSEEDLRRLEVVVREALGELDPALDLPPADRWRASLDGKVRAYSDDLRHGLAETLALLGVHGDRIDTEGGSGAAWASFLVGALLERANQDVTCRSWASIANWLPLLSEAAPDAFLDAVRQGATGGEPVLRGLFTDRDDSPVFGSHSAHTGLLWALENAAWSPDHFGQSIDLLARLAEIDPGGRLSNRPDNSLAEIYCPWHPETSVEIPRRLAVLDAMRKRHSEIAWRLMLSTLPEAHAIHSPTHEPRFRDWKTVPKPVRTIEYLQFISEVVGRLLDDASTTRRWIALLEKYSQLPPDDRDRVRGTLSVQLADKSVRSIDTAALWEALRALIARHRQYAYTDWAIPEEELQLLEAIEVTIQPAEPTLHYAWLFADHLPDLSHHLRRDDFHEYETALGERRRIALAEILRAGGLEAARLLAKDSPVPWSIGVAIADAQAGAYEGELLALIEGDGASDVELALAYAARRFSHDGWAWIDRLTDEASSLTDSQRAQLLLATRDYPRAWVVAEQLGRPIAIEFWKRFRPYGLGADFAYAETAARRLMEIERWAVALQLLELYIPRAESGASAQLITQALEGLLAGEFTDPELPGLSQHDFEALFQALDDHVDTVGWERIARLQWAFLPALGFEPKVQVLHRLLSNDPAFFVDVLSKVYRAKSGDDRRDDSPEHARTAMNGYRLLSSWSTLPGLRDDDSADGQALRTWIGTALAKLDEAGRRDIGEIHIGHVLACAPADADGQWPATTIRDVLEELQNERIEEGFITKTLNRRGITTRSPEDGGVQERELAAKYRREAESFADDWPRTAAILRALAASYDHHARREEGSAERFRRGYYR
jgi:hypothetical protein